MMKTIKINLELNLRVLKMLNYNLQMHQIVKNMIYIRKGEEEIWMN